jgi:diguanylate cyclase (GGDEF)-like protein
VRRASKPPPPDHLNPQTHETSWSSMPKTLQATRLTPWRGLRARIAAPMAVAAIVVTICGIVLLFHNQRHHLEARVTDRLVAAGETIAEEASVDESQEELQRNVTSLARSLRMEAIVVVGGEPPTVVAAHEPTWVGRPLTELPDPEHIRFDLETALRGGKPSLDLDHDDRRHLIDYSRPLAALLGQRSRDGRPVGAVIMHLDTDALYQRQARDTLWLGAWAFCAMGCLCSGLYYLLSKLVLRPLEKLMATVGAIRAGDASARARMLRNDELGDLGGLLDATLDQLAESERVTQAALARALRAAQQARWAATTDALTGLANRHQTIEVLQSVIERARAADKFDYFMMFLDFDGFKRINDALGHEVGDDFLRASANRLRAWVRAATTTDESSWLVARLGGDEFVVLLLESLRDAQRATEIAGNLVSAFQTPLPVRSNELQVSISIGVALGSDRYTRAEELLRDADTAMYEAKRRGKGQFVLFDAAMRENVVRQHRLDADLRQAIGTEQLWLAYQPIVSLASGEVKAVEALARWQHPVLGNIPPGEFIPLSEESDLIIALGRWVLDEGCRQMARWIHELGPAAPELVSLNVSRRQFQHADLIAHIRAAMDAAALEPGRIQIEITEDMYAGDLTTAVRTMHQLKELGVHLAIDDFGVGASSFSALHQFPVDVLKVDRSLLSEIERSQDTAALVHSLAILVRNLGIDMVAEGVEEARQVVALQDLGCHFGQGYFFSKPLPASEIAPFLVTRQAASHGVSGASSFGGLWSGQLAFYEPIDIEQPSIAGAIAPPV